MKARSQQEIWVHVQFLLPYISIFSTSTLRSCMPLVRTYTGNIS